MVSGVVGDGGTFGLEPGDGHKLADVTEEVGSANSPSAPGSLDSSCGSMTIGRDEGGDFFPNATQLSRLVKETREAGEARSYASKVLADSGVGAKIISYSYNLEEAGTQRRLSATESGDPPYFISIWSHSSPPTGFLLSNDLQDFIPVKT